MATRTAYQLAILTDYTQAEEDIYAAQLLSDGASSGNGIIFNTTLGRSRMWDGSAFANAPQLVATALPSVTSTEVGVVAATGSPTGKFLRDDNTWQTIAGGGDMVLASAQTNSGIKTFLDTTMKLRNVANTFDGYFVNTNTADRIYTLQNRAGTLADDTDLALKANLASPTFTGTVVFPSGQALVAPALGTPASGVLTSCTGYTEANLSFTDITTNNATDTVHGFFPKLTANSVYYVDSSGVLVALSLGGSGTVLKSNGGASAPTFDIPPASNIYLITQGGYN